MPGTSNIDNVEAGELQLAERRKENANALLATALTKATALEPPYSDNIAVRREIQACKDLVRVENQSYADYIAGTILPQPVPGAPATTGTYMTAINFLTGF